MPAPGLTSMRRTDRSITRVRLPLLLATLAALFLTSWPASRGLAAADPPAASIDYAEFVRARGAALRDGDAAPADLDAWRAQREALRQGLLRAWGGFPTEACPLEPKELGILQRDGYRIEKVVFQTRPGVWMTANAYVPDRPGKHPAILQVHGHWPGAKQDPVVQSRCIGAAKLGFFVLVVDAFGAGERGVKKALGEYHGDMTGATLLPVGLPLSGLQVYENMRAVDYLQTRPEVDAQKIGITGASGGGNQSMYAGAFDERFGAVVPVCSVGNYLVYLRAACCMCEVVPGALRFTDEWGVLGLTAPRPLMVVNATKDAVQFSVAEAQKTLGPLEQVFRLYGEPDHLKHAVFESKHDYNRDMREAMYGWMTRHLKGEGDGAPIPEPEIETEDPETLRCYPGDSRPDDFMTIPRFAAAEGRKLLAARPLPAEADGWRHQADRRRKALVETVFGGFPDVPPPGASVVIAGNVESLGFDVEILGFDVEPRLRQVSSHGPAPQKAAPLVVLIEPDGMPPADRSFVDGLERAGWAQASIKLRAIEPRAPAKAKARAGRSPDHNPAEWGLWIGRPLLGQWTFDVRRFLDVLEQTDAGLPPEVILVGQGTGGLVALCAGALDRRVTRVAAVGTLASYITEVPYQGQRLGLMAPGILREVGDVAHLAALCAPKRVVIAGGVAGDGKPLSADALRAAYEPALHVGKLLGSDEQLTLIDATDPAGIIQALK